MILGFKQYFPWNGVDGKPEPTYFKEKITELYRENQPNPIIWTPKIHTFREDPHNRWKIGMKVQMVYRGAGYKILDHFNKNIPELDQIESIQTIIIIPHKETVPEICVDGKWLTLIECEQCIKNDGFDNSNQFIKWFKKPFDGKILHFTDFRYE